MIQVDQLALSYSSNSVFDGVCFSLQKGERCALIGRNGSGKSSLFRLLVAEESADGGVISIPKGYRIGHLKQHIHFTQPTVVLEAALGLREEEKDALYKVEKLLLGLGFTTEQYDADPKGFSGGYQLRIQLAKVLLSEPDCLLLDEPTNYLDILSMRFLAKFLRQWTAEMIIISHDLDFLDAVTTHTMAIHRKKALKVKGKTEDLFALIAQEEELHEKTRISLEKKKAHLESFVERFGAKASKATQAASKKKALDKMPSLEKLKSLYQLDFSFRFAPFAGKKMLQASEVSFGYSPDHPLISSMNFSIEKGDRVAIIGKNGYGKSTLLKLLSAHLSPSKGTVEISTSAHIGYFGQTNIDRLELNLKIEDEVGQANPSLNFTQVRAICGALMFSGDLAKKSISVLSGGEKSRVLLGKILAKPCNLLFLDEPTHHLDIESIEALIDAVDEFEGACVFVTHSEWVLKRIPFTKLIICHKDRQEIFLGNYEEFLQNQGWQEEKDTKKKEKKAPAQERSGSLATQIRKCEEKIEELENSIDQKNLKLSSMPSSEHAEIQKILASIQEDQSHLNSHYDRLGDLYSQTS